ncbi:manganese peroxidase 2 [Ceratobasidium sp. AG-Ba]|nr:manganese peroxidase 2 [Ceratobasidium sp. AG-Ba]
MLHLLALALSTCIATVSADYTWPNPVWDELEDLAHLQSGPLAYNVAQGISPCDGFPQNPNPARQASSEWLRTAFHDAISHDAATGTGGMDASLLFETERPENLGGRSFNDTFGFMSGHYSTRASMADLIALATYTAVRNCGGPPISIRAGRIDATGPAPEGRVPEPKDSTKKILKKFADAGFNQKDMIQMVACGHTLGGVHGEFFPELTGDPSPSNFARFDNTTAQFDNKVVTEYLAGTTKNPLVTAPGGNNSDLRVFNSDGNSTMRAMSSPKAFLSTCGSILQRMIDTVPASVKLSPPLTPLTIKPFMLQLQLLNTGNVQLSGYIRVKDDGKGQPKAVKLIYRDRQGKLAKTALTTSIAGDGQITAGPEGQFRFFDIGQAVLPNGISGFNVSVTSASGVEKVYNNNGVGYPLQDTLIYQQPQSCLVQQADANGNWNLTMTAAVRTRKGLQNPVMSVAVQSERPGTFVPLLTVTPVPMKLWRNTSSGYALYTGTYAIAPASWSTTVDLSVKGPDSQTFEDGFKRTDVLTETCAGF